MRSIDWTADNLAELVKRTGCDVFVHTWTDAEMKEPTWRAPDDYGEVTGASALVNRGIEPRVLAREASNPEVVAELFRAHGADLSVTAVKGCHYMLYGMWKVFDLMEKYSEQHQISYARIVRYRFDLRCEQLDALDTDLSLAANNLDALLAPSHNWARALGASFDGVIIAARSAYGRFMQTLLSEFDHRHRKMLQGERFIPELLIFESARAVGLNIVPASGEYSIVRAGGRVEQSFRHNIPSPMQRLRESAAAYVVITGMGAGWERSYLYQRWAEHSGAFLRKFVVISYRPFKRFKDQITSKA